MEPRHLALKLFLEELGVPVSIDTFTDRKRVQKAVYLGQRAGVDLGYRFGWYHYGPYSPRLARDYYELEDAVAIEDTAMPGPTLAPPVRQRLDRVKPALEVPESVNLQAPEWFELVASLDYLLKVRHLSHEEALHVLKDEKADLSPYANDAVQALERAGLQTPRHAA